MFPRLVTGPEMAAIDRRTIDDGGISALELMERAGTRVVETLQERWGGLEGMRVAVVCGKGNNGGDGLVVARLLANAGIAVDSFFGVDRAAIDGAAAHLLERLERVGGRAAPVPEGFAAVEALRRSDIVVDALLGTGLGEHRGKPKAGSSRPSTTAPARWWPSTCPPASMRPPVTYTVSPCVLASP